MSLHHCCSSISLTPSSLHQPPLHRCSQEAAPAARLDPPSLLLSLHQRRQALILRLQASLGRTRPPGAHLEHPRGEVCWKASKEKVRLGSWTPNSGRAMDLCKKCIFTAPNSLAPKSVRNLQHLIHSGPPSSSIFPSSHLAKPQSWPPTLPWRSFVGEPPHRCRRSSPPHCRCPPPRSPRPPPCSVARRPPRPRARPRWARAARGPRRGSWGRRRSRCRRATVLTRRCSPNPTGHPSTCFHHSHSPCCLPWSRPVRLKQWCSKVSRYKLR